MRLVRGGGVAVRARLLGGRSKARQGRLAALLICFASLALGLRAQAEKIDVLVAYTPSVEAYYEGELGVLAHALAALASANDSMANSQIGLELRLAHLQRVDYAESQENYEEDLDRLAEPEDGYLDELHAKRDEVGADLVCLLRRGFPENTAGIAYLLRNQGGDVARGFSVVETTSAVSSFTFQHEIGHNLGAAHDRENASGPGLFSYSYGHRFTDPASGERRTVMAYEPGELVNLFSSPTVTFNGVATGIAEGEEGEADNAKTLSLAAPVVAGYRASAPAPPPQAFAGLDIHVVDTESDGWETVQLDGSYSYSREGIVSWAWTWEGGSAIGARASGQFPVGATTVTLVVTDSLGQQATDLVEVVVAGGGPMRQISAGDGFVLALQEGGALYARGSNEFGQIGLPGGESPSAFTLLLAGGVTAIGAGRDHSLFVKQDGSAWGMGRNVNGQLGLPGSESRTSPVEVAASGVAEVAAGGAHSLFLKTDGSLWGAGSSSVGQIGQPNGGISSGLVEIIASGVSRMAPGWSHSLAVKDDGSLWVMGSNQEGQLGLGSEERSQTPTLLRSSGVLDVAAGSNHTLFLTQSGSLWAMGRNNEGQLGLGDGDDRLEPTRVRAGGVVAIAAGGNRSLFRMEDGSVWIMGDLGFSWRLRSRVASSEPKLLVRGRVAHFGAGTDLVYLARDDGSVWIIEFERDYPKEPVLGQIVEPFEQVVNDPPVAVAGPERSASDTDADGVASIALDGSGSYDDWKIESWEWTWEGGSASGRAVEVELPVGEHQITLKVTDDEGATGEETFMVTIGDFSQAPIVKLFGGGAGSNATFALQENGVLRAAGSNAYGQLGKQSDPIFHYAPVMVLGADGAAGSAEERYSLLLKTDGSVWGMGRGGNGQLGPDASVDNPEPIQIFASGAKSVLARGSSYVVTEEGALWSFGGNYHGTLGDGTRTNRKEPFRVFETGVSSVSSTGETTYAVMEDGSVWAMGRNEYGLLGPDSEEVIATPTRIIDSGVASLYARGHYNFYYIRNDGTLWERDHSRGDMPLMAGGAEKVALGSEGIWVLKRDGSLWAKGRNGTGRLGDGTREELFDFTVIHYSGVIDIASFSGYGWFLRENGEVWGTGSDWNGETDVEAAASRELSQGKVVTRYPIQNRRPKAVTAGIVVAEGLATDGMAKVELDGTRSRDDWQIVSWDWTWDGGSASGRRARMEFEKGTHEVTLRVTDHAGLSDEAALQVSVIEPYSFANWMGVYFSQEERQAMGEAGPTLDLDGDGLTNSEEFELRLNPTLADARIHIEMEREGEGVLCIRAHDRASGEPVSLWRSTDLENWEWASSQSEVRGNDLIFHNIDDGIFYQVREDQ